MIGHLLLAWLLPPNQERIVIRRLLGPIAFLVLLVQARWARADECEPDLDLAHRCFCRIGIQPVFGIAVGTIFERELDFFLRVERVIEPAAGLESVFSSGDELELFQVPSFSSSDNFMAINTSGQPSSYDLLVSVPPDGSITQLRGLNTPADPHCAVAFSLWSLAEILTSEPDTDGTCIQQVHASADIPPVHTRAQREYFSADHASGLLPVAFALSVLLAMRRRTWP